MTPDRIVIRPATPGDITGVVAFNARNHHPRPDGRPNERIAARTGDLLGGRHPTCTTDHCLVAELGHRIVGSATAIPQTWILDGADLRVEMIEFVAVDRSLRGRGLGRRLMQAIHTETDRRGATLTAIIGRPSFYSRFGYHALPIGAAEHRAPSPETLGTIHSTRPATPADLHLVEASQPRSGLHVHRDRRTLAYELQGRSDDSVFVRHLRLVERLGNGRPLGWYTLARSDTEPMVDNVTVLEPSDLGDVLATVTATHPDVTYALGPRHPASRILDRFGPYERLHVRVADTGALLAAATARHGPELTVAVDRQLFRIGGSAGPSLIESTDDDQIDAADVHVSPAALTRIALGLQSIATVADYDADVEFTSPYARQHLHDHFPLRTNHLWPVG